MSLDIKDTKIDLWNDQTPKNGYSEEELYRSHILEQYKIYLELADRISIRRDLANIFFLTINGLVLAGSGALIDKGISFTHKPLVIFPLAILLIQCFFWWSIINSYKQLNGVKFNIVGEFETRLPASPYRKAEWLSLLKQGKDKKTYWPLTHIESKIPGLFAAGYVFAAICLLAS